VTNNRLFLQTAESKLKLWWNKAGDLINIIATDTVWQITSQPVLGHFQSKFSQHM